MTALGSVPLDQLTTARTALHWALQPVAAVGRTHLPQRKDDSHTNLGWSPATRTLAGHAVGDAGIRCGLRLHDFHVVIVDAEDNVLAEFALAERTLNDEYEWIAEVLVREAGLKGELTRPTYDLPDHESDDGVPFKAVPADALDEWQRWYGVAHTVLNGLAEKTPGASPVRCWPHHFDIATLVSGVDPENDKRTVGAGLSPGDSMFAEPYWYVSPWPRPAAPNVSSLPSGGEWHTEGWFGAVLKASSLGPLDQESQISSFLHKAVDIAKRLR